MKEMHKRWKKIYEYLCSTNMELLYLGLTLLINDEECWKFAMTKLKYRTDRKYLNCTYLGTLDTKLFLNSQIVRDYTSMMLDGYYIHIQKTYIEIYSFNTS